MSSLFEELEKLGNRIPAIKDNLQTEEATKHALVMPFFQILGYDIFDPSVVIPEYIADVGIKKGEKVDYAIMHEGEPVIIVEAKKLYEPIEKHTGQLFRYFNTTPAKFALLTNGVEYRFFSDIDNENKLDESPFLVINLEELNKRDVKALEKFIKSELNIASILEMANKQKYILEIKSLFEKEALEPSNEFAKFFASNVYLGARLTQSIIDDFKFYTKNALNEIISDLATKKINSIKAGLTAKIEEDDIKEQEEQNESDDGIVTTEEELQGFFIVKSILSEVVELDNIFARDTKSYFGILFEDNNRKWIARLHFNTSNKYIGIHEIEKQEAKYPIEKLEDIYKFKEKLIFTIKRLQEQ